MTGAPGEDTDSQGERTYTDRCNGTDGQAVNPAGRSRTDGEGDTVHGGQESDGRHSRGTDLDDDMRGWTAG
ncbi:hypothetical protein [Mycobacterium sp.]|uniref:hypothetical protein n=1 Tax=Mycobacterium sp. TaxID=1785 RepID=UPI003C750963